jgi:hypothetical protein
MARWPAAPRKAQAVDIRRLAEHTGFLHRIIIPERFMRVWQETGRRIDVSKTPKNAETVCEMMRFVRRAAQH